MKGLLFLLMGFTMVGCASKGDLMAVAARNDALTLRVIHLEDKSVKLEIENQNQQIQNDNNAAKINYLAREVRDLNTKLDNVYKKTLMK
jgi:outer membrane murein-binding lipoprotein Lpp